jgi:hypothetical protein
MSKKRKKTAGRPRARVDVPAVLDIMAALLTIALALKEIIS